MSDMERYNPRNHPAGCAYHVDQYPWECTCGLIQASHLDMLAMSAFGAWHFEDDPIDYGVYAGEAHKWHAVVSRVLTLVPILAGRRY